MMAFFKVGNEKSMMRLLSFACVCFAIIIAVLSIILGRDLSDAAILCGVFLGTAFGGKVAQSFSENKGNLK